MESKGIIKDKVGMDLFNKLYDKAMTPDGLEEEDPDIFVPVDDVDNFWQSLKAKHLVSTEYMNELKEAGEKFYVRAKPDEIFPVNLKSK